MVHFFLRKGYVRAISEARGMFKKRNHDPHNWIAGFVFFEHSEQSGGGEFFSSQGSVVRAENSLWFS
jgi:hypothetical protein